MKLTPEQNDALTEITNIGISTSATQLSALLDDDILLEVPEVVLLPACEVSCHIDDPEAAMGIVYQDLTGDVQGRAHLVFPTEESKVLVQALLGALPSMKDLDMRLVEHEALTEIGNIVISSCVSIFADQLHGTIELTVPNFSVRSFNDCLVPFCSAEDNPHVLIIKTTLRAAKKNVTGLLIIMLTLESTNNLIEKLSNYVESHKE